MQVNILEEDSRYELEKAINSFLSSDYTKKYRKIIDIKYSSYSTRFSGEYYSAMIIWEDEE